MKTEMKNQPTIDVIVFDSFEVQLPNCVDAKVIVLDNAAECDAYDS